MTTLGYGDVTPKTFFGKILTTLCVILGLLKLSLLTGALISVITEKTSLSFKDKIVVVKNLTAEQLIAEKQFNAKTIVMKSYEDVLAHISDSANEDTAAALIDINVARFMVDLAEENNKHKHELSLAIVDKIDEEIPITLLVPKEIFSYQRCYQRPGYISRCYRTNTYGFNVADCINKFMIKLTTKQNLNSMKFPVYKRPIDYQTVALSLSMREIFQEDPVTVCLMIVAFLLMICIASVAFVPVLRRIKARRRRGADIEQEDTNRRTREIKGHLEAAGIKLVSYGNINEAAMIDDVSLVNNCKNSNHRISKANTNATEERNDSAFIETEDLSNTCSGDVRSNEAVLSDDFNQGTRSSLFQGKIFYKSTGTLDFQIL